MQRETRIAAAEGAGKFGMVFTLLFPILTMVLLFIPSWLPGEHWDASSDFAKAIVIVLLIASELGAVVYAFQPNDDNKVTKWTILWAVGWLAAMAILYMADVHNSINLQ